jgi:flagellar basal-body rod protein FlgG
MRSLSIAATGMLAQQLNVEVISNNIANMNTTGFRRQRAEFQDLLYQNLRRSGTQSSDTGTVVPAGVEVGTGVKTAAVYRISEQGNLQSTDNPYDVAIQGNGFFRVTLPSGEDAYTRAGSLQVSSDGQLVTTDGYVVAPGITIPSDAIDVSINRNGEVSIKTDGTVAPTVAGQGDGDILQRRRPGKQGRQHVHGNAGLGHRVRRCTGQPGLWQRPARLPGNFERQCGRRNYFADYRTACL